MVSARAKSNQIVLVSDVVLLGVMQWVVVRDVGLNTAVLRVRRAVDCQKLLGRFEDGSLAPRSIHVFLAIISLTLSSSETYHKS